MVASLLIFLSLVSFAGTECKPMRLDGPGGPMEKMPMLDQGDIGYCYAVTSSAAIDAYRFSHGDTNYDHITSPFALAQKHRVFNNQSAESLREKIAQMKALDAISPPTNAKIRKDDYHVLARRLSDQLRQTPLSVLPINAKPHTPPLMYDDAAEKALSKSANYLDGGWVPWVYLANTGRDQFLKSCDNATLEKFAKHKKDLQKMLDLWSLSKADRIQYKQSKEVCALESHDYVLYGQSIDQAAKETNLQDYLDKIVDNACEEKAIKVSLPENTIIEGSQTKNIADSLKAALNLKNPQPATLSYCAGFYWNKTKGKVSEDSCEYPHGSSVVGMRPASNGKCEFLVRSTWGKECTWGYPKEKCENGSYWVDEETMNNNGYSYSLLLDEDQKKSFMADKSWQKK
jgi:hypothetical protein